MDTDRIGTERHTVRVPYAFRSRAACPFLLESAEEGEHNVPRILAPYARPLQTSLLPFEQRLRPLSSIITLVPPMPLHVSDDSVQYSDCSSDEELEAEVLDCYGSSGVSLWRSLPELLSSGESGQHLAKNVIRRYEATPDDEFLQVLHEFTTSPSLIGILAVQILRDFYSKQQAYQELLRIYLATLDLVKACTNLKRLVQTLQQLVGPTSVICSLREAECKSKVHALWLKLGGLHTEVF